MQKLGKLGSPQVGESRPLTKAEAKALNVTRGLLLRHTADRGFVLLKKVNRQGIWEWGEIFTEQQLKDWVIPTLEAYWASKVSRKRRSPGIYLSLPETEEKS